MFRKTILFLILLCAGIAYGRADYSYRYWFDSADDAAIEGTSSGEKLHIDADISHLDDNLHTIYIQVEDSIGWSAPISRQFVKLASSTSVQTYYWFGGNEKSKERLPMANGKMQVDVSKLEDGLHDIHIMAMAGASSASASRINHFIKMPICEQLEYVYWFDNQRNTIRGGRLIDGIINLDVAEAADGFHTLYLQATGIGGASIPVSRMFIKIPQTEYIGEMICVCLVDGKFFKQEKVPTESGVVNWNLDVSELSQGVHNLQVQVLTPSGAASNVYNSFFFRTTKPAELSSMKFIYNVDGSEYKEGVGSGSNGGFHFDLDVAALSDDLHSLNYMLVGDNGLSTVSQTAYFVKTPVGGEGIDSYKYWLNDDDNSITTVKLEQRTSPYQLIKLLPVATEPIRSQCFHFEVNKDGEPVLYAKNDIHFQFMDASTRIAEVHKQFIDYKVSQKVTGITPLKTTQTFVRPEKNGIKWFEFTAEKGDTIAFSSSQAATLQVYSPSGKEIYAASADKSMTYGGCHTWESGVHYVALHDVTGSRQNVTLDYMHMDKYDVVAQDVKVVGNGGASTITFYGNGFDNLYAVDFINSANDTISAVHIKHISDAEVGITADFNTAKLGYYDAVFYFTEDTKSVASSILVEKAKDIELASKVSYQSTFLRSSGKTTYTVNIKNKGNMTSYGTPVYIYVSSKKPTDISKIEIDGLDLPKIYDNLDTDSLTAKDWEMLKDLQDKIGETHYFIGGMTKSEETNDSIYACSNYFFTNIAPNENKKFTITVYTTNAVEVWVTTAPTNNAMSELPKQETDSPRNKTSKSIKDNYCCVRNKVECVASIIADAATIANIVPGNAAIAVADCVASSLNTTISVIGTVMCDDKSVEKNFWDKMNSTLNGTSALGTICSCALNNLPWKKWATFFEKFGDILGKGSFAFGIGVDQANCIMSFLSKVPNCPPIPPDGGGSHPVNSLDPNDIYGYTAESGSKFIADSVQHVNYRIEFENDTAFATASAHVVEVKNAIDGRYFDLKSFKPTSIKIGDKVEYLDGTPNFVKTIDMRPQIYTIVQVEGRYNSNTGDAKWTFQSLDPITMEPTDDVMQGFLPINYDGVQGIGEVAYDIDLKKRFADGTEIPNKASIVFDSNEPIETPTWINTVDAVAPESKIIDVTQKNDSTVTVSFGGSDARSGVWKYDIYTQYGKDTPWEKIATCGADSSYIDFTVYNGVDYGFCVLATDSAGNEEKKPMLREGAFVTVKLGDVNCDGIINTLDASLTIAYYINPATPILARAADVNEDGKVNSLDATQILQMYINSSVAKSTKAIPARKRLKQLKTTNKHL